MTLNSRHIVVACLQVFHETSILTQDQFQPLLKILFNRKDLTDQKVLQGIEEIKNRLFHSPGILFISSDVVQIK